MSNRLLLRFDMVVHRILDLQYLRSLIHCRHPFMDETELLYILIQAPPAS